MWPFTRKPKLPPPAPIQDEVLGELRYEEQFWNAKVRRGPHELEISIVGDHGGPDPLGRQLVVDLLGKFDEVFAAAVEFQLKDLSDEERGYCEYNFRPTGIWSGSTWQLQELSVTLTMEMEGDPDGLWRVEIGPDGPRYSGRDS